MSDTFVVETTYSIFYNTESPVPIPLIIESLENLEKLIRRTPKFLEKKYKGIQVVDTQVFVSHISTGSLMETFLVKYVFKGKENYEKAKEVWDTIMADNTAIRTVVAAGVGAFIAYGVMQALPKGAPSSHIEAHHNTIINIGGKVDMSSEDIQAVLDSVSDKRALAKEAVAVVKPAKADKSATIEIDGIKQLTMDSDFIAEAPAEFVKPIPAERESTYANVDVVIYASDRDRSEQGWAGVIPQLFDKRVSFKLGEKVQPSKVHGRTRIKADVVVHEKYVPSKKAYEVKSVEIIAVN